MTLGTGCCQVEENPASLEHSWQFTLALPWKAGRYRLVVEPYLKDVAGNSTHRGFDRDITKDGDSPSGNGRVATDFATEA